MLQQMRSAAAAGMNMLLLWGGGIWQHTAFYEEADRLGLMIYHDLMQVCRPTRASRVL
jgi:beta-mannosidase